MNKIKDKISTIKGLSFSDYIDNLKKKVNTVSTSQQSEETIKLIEYAKLNLHRMERINKTYEPSYNLKSIMNKIKSAQLWLAITEDWCGDSAQILPYIHKIASLNTKISLKIIERDKNLDIIDIYLTDGKRSIPKIIGFDNNWKEIFTWGPRPIELAGLFKEWKELNISKNILNEKVHLWYARNRGIEIEKEFTELLSNLNQD